MSPTKLLGVEMTEYVIREIGRRTWLVFADRQSIALCADENEAVKAMTEHSAREAKREAMREFRESLAAAQASHSNLEPSAR
jgi:hypothetical protein